MTQLLEIVFTLDALRAIDIWRECYGFLGSQGYSPAEKCDISGDTRSLKKADERIQKSSRNSFNVEINEYFFMCSAVTNWNHFLLYAKARTDESVSALPALAERFVEKAGFLQAWLVDYDYDHWQNAHDPLQYSAAGRSLEGLPRVSNGLPPPLEQLNIDTSNNPGRRIIRHGYVEAVAAVMWLGDAFWPRVGKLKQDFINGCPSASVSYGPNHVRLQVAETLFDDFSDVDLQDKLRVALYPEAHQSSN